MEVLIPFLKNGYPMPKKLFTLKELAEMTSILRPGNLSAFTDMDDSDKLTAKEEIELDNLKSQSQELNKLISNEDSNSINLISKDEINEALTITQLSGVILTLNRTEEPLQNELGKKMRIHLNKTKPSYKFLAS